MTLKTSSATRILCISGPNLQLLGTREPDVYGTRNARRNPRAPGRRAPDPSACTSSARQTNHEGAIVDWIGAAPTDGFAGLILQPRRVHAHVDRHPRRAERGRPCRASRCTCRTPMRASRSGRRSRIARACVGSRGRVRRRQLRARSRGPRTHARTPRSYTCVTTFSAKSAIPRCGQASSRSVSRLDSVAVRSCHEP